MVHALRQTQIRILHVYIFHPFQRNRCFACAYSSDIAVCLPRTYGRWGVCGMPPRLSMGCRTMVQG